MDLNDGDMVDRISNLPNGILDQIFSFLPIRDVVRTSVLSNRWEYTWESASCLDFSYPLQWGDVNSETKLACFKNFVDRVLFYHGGSSIQKCAFNCCSSHPFPFLYSWICAVLACNVQELYVSCSYLQVHDLPPSLFTYSTLVTLKLKGKFLLNLPFRVCFPNLKTLALVCVIFVDDFSMQRLLSSCPVLEDLEIKRNGWNGVLVASISVPSLKKIAIHSLFKCVNKNDGMYKMVINAPCLESLMITDGALKELSVNSSNYLVQANIGVSCALKALRDISNVQELRIYETALENLDNASTFTLPVLHKLTSLWLEFDYAVSQNLFSAFLRSSPNLEVLDLSSRVLGENSVWNPTRRQSDSVPACLLTLKRIVFRQFLWTEFEQFLVRYMLKHTLILEDMTIFTHDSDKSRFSPKMRNSILRYKRGSPSCKVLFEETKFDYSKPKPEPNPFS